MHAEPTETAQVGRGKFFSATLQASGRVRASSTRPGGRPLGPSRIYQPTGLTHERPAQHLSQIRVAAPSSPDCHAPAIFAPPRRQKR